MIDFATIQCESVRNCSKKLSKNFIRRIDEVRIDLDAFPYLGIFKAFGNTASVKFPIRNFAHYQAPLKAESFK
jgi:hypothetical protein